MKCKSMLHIWLICIKEYPHMVEVTLGKSVYLPCQCGDWNFGSNSPPKWENSRGEDLLLIKPGDGIVSRKHRKYILFNDVKWLKTRGDCSLVLRNATWEDQGEYTCTYLEPEFEFVPYQNYWIKGHITRRVTLMIKDLSPIGVFTVTEGVQEQYTTVTTPRVNSTHTKSGTLVPERTENVHTTTQTTTPAMTLKGMKATTVTTSLASMTFGNVTQTSNVTSSTVKDVINVTQKLMFKIEPSVNSNNEIVEVREQMIEENYVDSSVTAQRTISNVDNNFSDSDQTPEYMTGQYHALQKRETKWRAFGFDPSVLQIADPWASKNLWFQQLTHSVRSVVNWNGPCLVKVLTPNSWPSILETTPEPLTAICQSYALSWLLYQQQSAGDPIMAL
uniref:Ig-like domain-containing protein n=1 Tax=Cyclopterus lumpus TaxID=8103 RepID=A0A8C2Z599_CYCLU